MNSIRKLLALILTTGVSLALRAETPRWADKLSVWFRADRGVTVDESTGAVTGWANGGTLGSALDLSRPQMPASTGVSMTTLGGAPALHFDGTDYLISAGASNLGLTSAGGAWFVVFKPADNSTRPSSNMSLFGLAGSSGRFGAFTTGLSDIQTYVFNTACYVKGVMSESPQILSCSAYKDASDAGWLAAFSNGVDTKAANSNTPVTWSATPWSGNLSVGYFNASGSYPTWVKCFFGDIAEVRVYSGPLTAAERASVEVELAARYSIPLSSFGGIPAALSSGLGQDIAVAGFQPARGRAADVAGTAVSGGATFAFNAAPSETVDSLVCLSHGGAPVDSREWLLAGTEAARACTATLTVAPDAVPDAVSPRLYVRQTSDGCWTMLDAEPVRETDGSLAFALTAGWQSGRYRLMDASLEKLAVWYRADVGVTSDGDGNVSRWANCGNLGSALDLVPSEANAGDIVRTEAGFGGKPVLTFGGLGYLESVATSSLCADASAGGAWFLVYDPVHDASQRVNMTLLGMPHPNSQLQSSQRSGAFIVNVNGLGTAVKPYFFAADAANQSINDAPQILADSAWRKGDDYCSRASLNGVWGAVCSKAFAAWSGQFYVGKTFDVDWTANFKGRIAEVRFYNRPLTATESMEVLLDLSDRYGITVAIFGGIDNALSAGHAVDRKVFGAVADQGVSAPESASATSGGLTVSFVDGLPGSGNTLTSLGHDGAEGRARTWYLSGCADAQALRLDMTVDGPGLTGRERLFIKAVNGVWKMLDAEPQKNADGTLSFVLPTWANGLYRVATVPEGAMAVCYRSDTGVTVENGGVTGWKNLGTAGSVYDLSSVSNNNGVTLVEDAFGDKPALRFDGTDILKSASAPLGIFYPKGGAWFVAYRLASDAAASSNIGLFGLSDPTVVMNKRFGAFIPTQASLGFNAYWFGKLPTSAVPASVDGDVLSLSTWSNETSAAVVSWRKGVRSSDNMNAGTYSAYEAPILVGTLNDHLSWLNFFRGDIAEIRIYNAPLSAAERAQVETEMASRYGLVSSMEVKSDLAGHGTDMAVIGTAKDEGRHGAPVSGWSDGVLSFALPDGIPADTSSLVSLGSDGGAAAFPEDVNGRSRLARSWYVSPAVSSVGGTFVVDCETDAAKYKYLLRCRADGSETFVTTATGVVDGACVRFDAETLSSGVYVVERREANRGFLLLLR